MSVRSYLLGLVASTIVCWAAWAYVITSTNPTSGGTTALVTFYVTLGFALVGTIALSEYVLRVYMGRNELRYAHLNHALRHGLLGGVLACALLAMAASDLLAWWDILLLGVIALLLELYLRSYVKKPF
jgi:hypothetical protein